MTIDSVRGGGSGSNLPFDIRLTSYGAIGTEDSRGGGMTGREVSARRGYVRTDTTAKNGWGVNSPERWLYFLYNPSTLGAYYSMQDDPGAVVTAFNESNGKYMGLLSQTMEFSLLFDRTYEVMDGSKEGAWRDIRAALALVGVLNNVNSSAMYTTGSDFDAGPMTYVPTYLHFGNQAGGVTYYGYITSLSYEITHFSKDMIPIRVGMRISVNMLPTGNGVGPGSDVATSPSQDSTGEIPEKSVPSSSDMSAEELADLMYRLSGDPPASGADTRLWNN